MSVGNYLPKLFMVIRNLKYNLNGSKVKKTVLESHYVNRFFKYQKKQPSNLKNEALNIGAIFSAISLSFLRPSLSLSFVKSTSDKETKPSQEFNIIFEADALYDAVKYEELYDTLYKYKDAGSDEILWRLTRAAFRKSKIVSEKEEKIKLLKDAKKYIYQALEINDTNFAAHKWASIVVVELAEFEGTKAKIEQSIVSKDHMMKAHVLNPKDGTTLYLIGTWCFTFANLSWHERKLAGLLFATPPSSSFEEALVYFQKAEQVEPNFYSMNLLMLAKTHLKLANKEAAVEYLRKAQNYPQKTDEDKQAKEEAEALLKNLGVK